LVVRRTPHGGGGCAMAPLAPLLLRPAKNAAGALYKTICQNVQLTLCNK